MPKITKNSIVGERFTPTRVGNAFVREEGEDFLRGSPPRGWGMHNPAARNIKNARFTPTRVGNAGELPQPGRAQTVHPHAGGECSLPPGHSPGPPGSPPRGWGMPYYRLDSFVRDRFTPTRVGNALENYEAIGRAKVHPHAGGECCPAHRSHPAVAVHPHAGGECSKYPVNPARVPGSPPRGWGMLAGDLDLHVAVRFTPTRVGNAVSAAAARSSAVGSPPRGWGMPPPTTHSSLFTPVHPHAGGECSAIAASRSATVGSPPRGWGMPIKKPQIPLCRRFTPTRVGNACAPFGPCSVTPVHPHAGGECAGAGGHGDHEHGSPPRGWGMPIVLYPEEAGDRFTPTRVGNAQKLSLRGPG